MEDIHSLSESQITDLIVAMSNSGEYLELRKYYAEESFFKTIGVSRKEEVHSNFIAWLLRPTSNHELNYYPLQKFLQMLSRVYKNENNAHAQFNDEYAVDFLLGDYELTDGCKVVTEAPTGTIAGFDNRGRIDILLELTFKGSNKILPIIIENKVLSTENNENTKSNPDAKNKQTEKYFEWSKMKYPCGDGDPYSTPILIFLAPDYEKDIKCKCDAFFKISYQNLIDDVIEPCLLNTKNGQAIYLIENYLRCLSNSTLDNSNSAKEGRIMGFGKKELELLRKFHDKNRDLVDAVLAMLEQDEEDEATRRKISAARSASSSHDHTKYSFNGKAYRKGPLMIALVDKYLEDHPKADIHELKRAFDLILVFNNKNIILLPKDTPPSLKSKAPSRTLFDGAIIHINNQVQIGDMEGIISIANSLGYKVDIT